MKHYYINNYKLKNNLKKDIYTTIYSFDELWPGLFVNEINLKNNTVNIEYLDEYDYIETQTLSITKYLNKCLRECGSPRIKKIYLF